MKTKDLIAFHPPERLVSQRNGGSHDIYTNTRSRVYPSP